jgi:N-acetylglucosamine kinase-like BadF-type ATPase
MTYYIGIDGGGTKTEGVLTDADGRVLSRSFGTASNPNDVTPEGAVTVLSRLVTDLLDAAGLTAEALPEISLFGGIAGGINGRDVLLEGLRASFPALGAVDIASDVHIFMMGEYPEGNGCCIICGTGSVCFLRCGDEVIRIGGWGYLLDSGGSGYDMGRDGLEAALRAHDGRGEKTLLSELLTAHLGAPVHQRITEIYQNGKPYIASCAPLIFQAAREGDRVALRILERNAAALATYVEAAWGWLSRKGQANGSLPVVMGGSISEKCAPLWQEMITEKLPASGPACITVASIRPVFGAVVEAARQSLGSDQQPDYTALRKAFLDSYRNLTP